MQDLAGERADAPMKDVAFVPAVPGPVEIIWIGQDHAAHVGNRNMRLPEKSSVF